MTLRSPNSRRAKPLVAVLAAEIPAQSRHFFERLEPVEPVTADAARVVVHDEPKGRQLILERQNLVHLLLVTLLGAFTRLVLPAFALLVLAAFALLLLAAFALLLLAALALLLLALWLFV